MLRAVGEGDVLRPDGHGVGWLRMSVDVAGAGPDGRAAALELHERLRAFVLRRVGDPAVADDLAQELALRLHASLDRLHASDRLDAYAFRIARNLIADHWRSRQARREEPLADDLAQRLEAPPDDVDARLSDDLRREVAGCLRPLLRQLPTSYREAIELTDLGPHTQAEAAVLLGLSLPGLKSRVQRGRDQLRGLLLACCAVARDARGNVTGFEQPPSCRAASGAVGTARCC